MAAPFTMRARVSSVAVTCLRGFGFGDGVLYECNYETERERESERERDETSWGHNSVL